jgi:hypothetical protein
MGEGLSPTEPFYESNSKGGESMSNISTIVEGVVRCSQCRCIVNPTKAARRYAQKYSGSEVPKEMDHMYFISRTLGLCACGNYVYVHAQKS